MTDTNIAQSEPVLVAIDISEARHEVLIAVPGKKRRRRLTVLNQLEHCLAGFCKANAESGLPPVDHGTCSIRPTSPRSIARQLVTIIGLWPITSLRRVLR